MIEAAGIAAQTALTRQSIALETLKSATEQSQALISLLADSAANVPVSESSGVNIDVSV